MDLFDFIINQGIYDGAGLFSRPPATVEINADHPTHSTVSFSFKAEQHNFTVIVSRQAANHYISRMVSDPRFRLEILDSDAAAFDRIQD